MRLNQPSWKLSLAVALAWGGSTQALAQQSRPAKDQAEDPQHDQIVEEFIQYDIGNVRDPRAIERIKGRFNGLQTDDAVPALVRGLNRSTRMRASCPITAIAGKLRSILSNSKDAELGTYVLQNLELRDVPGYTQHIRGVFDSAEKQVVRVKGKEYLNQQLQRRSEEDQQRLAYVPGLKLTDLAPRNTAAARAENGGTANGRSANDTRPAAGQSNGRRTAAASVTPPDLRRLSIAELVDRLNDKASQPVTLEELHRRASGSDGKEVAQHAAPIAKVLKDGDDKARESAARLLGLVRSESAVPQLIDALEDSNPSVRSAVSTSLTRITRQLFGPKDKASPEETREATARWRDWWSRQKTSGER